MFPNTIETYRLCSPFVIFHANCNAKFSLCAFSSTVERTFCLNIGTSKYCLTKSLRKRFATAALCVQEKALLEDTW